MSIVTRNRISGVVCQFSTGSEAPYYERVEHWFHSLSGGLKVINVIMMSVCPIFTQNEGCGHLIINTGREEEYIHYSYYKMPSGKWEIVCYLT
jgi:hypothetical protein